VSPEKYELGFYIPEDGILHSPRRRSLTSYTVAPLISRVPSVAAVNADEIAV
jgi:hypothetical protein